MSDGPKAPKLLYQMQKLFEETARTPFFFGEEVTPQPDRYHREMVKEMVAIKGITGRKRIMNYNQQYWYRLFSIMQEEYPLLAYLLGYQKFNHLVSGYLTDFPSHHYSLNFLSEDLPAFIKGSAKWGEAIIKETVELERIFIKAFDALQAANDLSNIPLSQEDLAVIKDQGIGFQPSWYLFEENWNLVALRKKVKLADDPEELEEKPQKLKSFWCIYRQKNRLFQEELNRTQYLLLEKLACGFSLMKAFECMEDLLNSEEIELLEKEVSIWFTRWVSLGWFTLPNAKK